MCLDLKHRTPTFAYASALWSRFLLDIRVEGHPSGPISEWCWPHTKFRNVVNFSLSYASFIAEAFLCPGLYMLYVNFENSKACVSFECRFANIEESKNIVLPKVKTETGKKAFSFQGAKIFNQLTEEMKTETLILRFKTLCKSFNFDF